MANKVRRTPDTLVDFEPKINEKFDFEDITYVCREGGDGSDCGFCEFSALRHPLEGACEMKCEADKRKDGKYIIVVKM
jgi:hypothetical protein